MGTVRSCMSEQIIKNINGNRAITAEILSSIVSGITRAEAQKLLDEAVKKGVLELMYALSCKGCGQILSLENAMPPARVKAYCPRCDNYAFVPKASIAELYMAQLRPKP